MKEYKIITIDVDFPNDDVELNALAEHGWQYRDKLGFFQHTTSAVVLLEREKRPERPLSDSEPAVR